MVTEKTDGHKSTISKLTDWEKKEGLVVVASLFDIKKILRLLHKRPFIIAKSTKRLLGEEGENFYVRRINNESTFKQVRGGIKRVRRPSGNRFDERFCVKTGKHSGTIMVWTGFGRAGISFLKLGTTMNAEMYVAILEDHLIEFMAEAAPTSCRTQLPVTRLP